MNWQCLFGKHKWGSWKQQRGGKVARQCSRCRHWQHWKLF